MWYGMFLDNTGKVSMQRVLAFMYGSCTLFLWMKFSLDAGKIEVLDPSTVTLLIGAQATTALQGAGVIVSNVLQKKAN